MRPDTDSTYRPSRPTGRATDSGATANPSEGATQTGSPDVPNVSDFIKLYTIAIGGSYFL